MLWRRLRYVGFFPPAWFNRVKAGEHDSTVNDDGRSISLDGEKLSIIQTTDFLPAGTPVIVRLRQNFEFVTASEHQAHLSQLAADRLDEKRKAGERKEKIRLDALRFNASLNIPVAWAPGIKPVLSGLTERSNGDGMNKDSVFHVMLLEHITSGRLRRESGDFLCTSEAGDNGYLSDLRHPEQWHVGEDQTLYQPKVTCKACLRVAQRWQGVNPKDDLQ